MGWMSGDRIDSTHCMRTALGHGLDKESYLVNVLELDNRGGGRVRI